MTPSAVKKHKILSAHIGHVIQLLPELVAGFTLLTLRGDSMSTGSLSPLTPVLASGQMDQEDQYLLPEQLQIKPVIWMWDMRSAMRCIHEPLTYLNMNAARSTAANNRHWAVLTALSSFVCHHLWTCLRACRWWLSYGGCRYMTQASLLIGYGRW